MPELPAPNTKLAPGPLQGQLLTEALSHQQTGTKRLSQEPPTKRMLCLHWTWALYTVSLLAWPGSDTQGRTWSRPQPAGMEPSQVGGHWHRCCARINARPPGLNGLRELKVADRGLQGTGSGVRPHADTAPQGGSMLCPRVGNA